MSWINRNYTIYLDDFSLKELVLYTWNTVLYFERGESTT